MKDNWGLAAGSKTQELFLNCGLSLINCLKERNL